MMPERQDDEFFGATFFDPNADVDAHDRRLPHWQQGTVPCFVTWRLGDALPQQKLRAWKAEKRIWLRKNPQPWTVSQREEYRQLFPQRIERWLDAGYGECLLRRPELASICCDALAYFHGARYRIISYVVMPNHVHALFQPLGNHKHEQIIKSWKGYTAYEINAKLGRSGEFWQADFWDRLIRNPDHFERSLHYIAENPAMAGIHDGEYRYFQDDEVVQEFRGWSDGG